MKCKYCKQTETFKKGKRNNVQRYYCKGCSKYFQETYSYKAYENTTDILICNLLREGCSDISIVSIF